jgi:hypothetical protein
MSVDCAINLNPNISDLGPLKCLFSYFLLYQDTPLFGGRETISSNSFYSIYSCVFKSSFLPAFFFLCVLTLSFVSLPAIHWHYTLESWLTLRYSEVYYLSATAPATKDLIFIRVNTVFTKGQLTGIKLICLKGPKHDQVGYEFFYIKQTRMVR